MIKWINKKRNKKGFTLVELVVVIAILGILAALAIPRLTGARDNAAKETHKANIRTLESAVSIYHAEHGVYPSPELTELYSEYVKDRPIYGDDTLQYYHDDGTVGIKLK